MASTIKRAAQALNNTNVRPIRFAGIILFGVVVWYLSRLNLWWLAVMVVVGYELLPGPFDRTRLEERLPAIIIGASVALTITLLPKAISQLVITLAFIVWRLWQAERGTAASLSLANLLLVQIVALEGLYLAAAVWNWSAAVMIILVWTATYVPTWLILKQRGERTAAVLAAAWALVATELTWVFMTWLVSYIVQASYLVVPQPTLILSALAYCFGSIYLAQRQGKLNRGRLTEYLLIGIILLAVVIAGTPWRGSL